MTGDREIMRLAHDAIETHSIDAVIVVGMKADACLDVGDFAAQRMWLLVLAAVEDIRRSIPVDGERLN
jgi:hypothetical protein